MLEPAFREPLGQYAESVIVRNHGFSKCHVRQSFQRTRTGRQIPHR
jgi:hypothetical protein